MSDNPLDHAPCPECGSTRLVQHVTQSEDLQVTEDGDIERIDPRDTVEIQELWCPECDEKIWERDENPPQTRVKVGFTIPATVFLDVESTDEREMWDALADKWESMSANERAELVSDVTGQDLIENLSYIDKYEDGDLVEVLHEY